MTTHQNDNLQSAPDDIKLAVDLIYLLETNEVDPLVALNAIRIVQQDLEKKITASEKTE